MIDIVYQQDRENVNIGSGKS